MRIDHSDQLREDRRDGSVPSSFKCLNTILTEFEHKAFGSLPIPSSTDDKDKIIFTPNDPIVIESKHLHATGYTKPDIVGMHLSSLRDIYQEHQKCNFKDMARLISESTLRKAKPSRKPVWRDPKQVWELKVKQKKPKFTEGWWSAVEIMHSADQSSSKATLKRANSDADVNNGNPAPKKSCASRPAASQSARPSIRPRNAAPLKRLPKLTYDDQCAFYAIDRLTASWTIMNCTVILLEGSGIITTMED